MKTTYKGYVAIPNLGRLRSRLSNPPQDLSTRIREQLQSIIAETLNENTLAIRAKLIDFVVNSCGLTFKSKAAEQQVAAVTGAIFDSFYASTSTALETLIGANKPAADEEPVDEQSAEEGEDTEEGDEEPADEQSAEEGEDSADEDFED